MGVKSMYERCSYQVELLPQFISTTCLMQCDSLSHVLSNLYQIDLHSLKLIVTHHHVGQVTQLFILGC